MTNYFRITAYHPTEDISVIMDSNGMFEKLWQFSAFMVSKGFKIIEASNETAFEEGDLIKATEKSEKILVRAYAPSEPKIQVLNNKKVITIQELSYTAMQ